MRRVSLIVGFLVLVVTGNTSHANTVAIPVPVAPPKQMSSGNSFYELSPSGVGRYMDVLRNSDPAAYKKLSSRASSIQSRQLWASISMYGGTGVGLVLTCVGAGTSSTPLLISGAGLVLVGGIAGLIMAPSHSDLLDFVNEHNEVRPKSPLKVSASLDVVPLGDGGRIALTFPL